MDKLFLKGLLSGLNKHLSIVHISFSLPDVGIGERLSPKYGGSRTPKTYLNLLKADLWVIDSSLNTVGS